MHTVAAVQASEKLTAMNDPEKGGSEYINLKIMNARDALVEPPETPEPPPSDAPPKEDAK